MSWYLTLPLLTPFMTAVLAVFVRSGGARWVSIAGSTLALVFAVALMSKVATDGVLVGQMGDWAAPFGIVLVADMLSATMVLLTAITGFAVAIYAAGEIDAELESLGFFSLFQILLAGVTGAFVTGDIFNLYVWFEVMLIASFGLLILGGRPEQIDGGVKYVTLNLLATLVLLAGIGLLYGATGTLNMADLSGVVEGSDRQGLMTVISMFFLVAFGMKAGVFPLFFWLPAAYPVPAYAVTAVFAGLLSKVGVYALFRVFTLIFDHDGAFIQMISMWVAGLTMVVGVVGALAQSDVRRVLSFQIISSIGYLILGLAIYTPLAIAGAILYLIHTILVKVALLLTAGAADRLTGDSRMGRTGGLYRTAPLLSVLFFIPAFSLAGFPPLSGFWPKLLLVSATIDVQAWVLTGVALGVGLLTIWSMSIVWAQTFWKDHPDGVTPRTPDLGATRRITIIPIAILVAMSVIVGLVPQPFITLAERIASELLDPSAYISAVMGQGGGA